MPIGNNIVTTKRLARFQDRKIGCTLRGLVTHDLQFILDLATRALRISSSRYAASRAIAVGEQSLAASLASGEPIWMR